MCNHESLRLLTCAALLLLYSNVSAMAADDDEMKPVETKPLTEPLKPIKMPPEKGWDVPQEEELVPVDPDAKEKKPEKPAAEKKPSWRPELPPPVPQESPPKKKVGAQGPKLLVSEEDDDGDILLPPPETDLPPAGPDLPSPVSKEPTKAPTTPPEIAKPASSTPAVNKPKPAPRQADSVLWAKAKEKARKDAKYYRKKPEQLVSLYREVVDAESANAEARYRLGLALARIGDMKGCVGQLERAIVLQPENAVYWSKLATAQARIGKMKKALDAGLRATQLEPASASAHNTLGSVFFMAGDLRRATYEYKSAISLDPRNVRYIHNLARAYLSAGENAYAVKILTEVIQNEPTSYRAYNDRGLALKALKKIKPALSDFEKAVQLKPEFALGHHNLAGIYSVETDPQFTYRFRALEHAQKAVKLTQGRNPTFLMGLAEAWRINRRYDKALMLAKQVVAVDPSEDNLKRLKRYQELVQRGFAGPVRHHGKKEDLDMELQIKKDKDLKSLDGEP